MKKRGILLILLIILIVISLVFINPFSKRGTFKELVFDEMSNTKFELIDISEKDMDNHSREQAYIKDSLDISRIIGMLNELKLSEVRSVPVENSSEASYYIDMITEDGEYVYLDFYKPTEYMRIGIDGKDFRMEKAFKIIDGEIDFKLLNEIVENNISTLP